MTAFTRRNTAQSLDISLLVSTFERPANLRRTLFSIARQQRGKERFELIVTDDGSRDETASLVARYAREVDFPVTFVTHPHDQFQLARCRNEGVAAARAPYLLFLDGDCVLSPDHVQQHLRHRTPGVTMAGDYYYLEREISAGIDEQAILRGDFPVWPSWQERRRLIAKRIKSHFYRWLRVRSRPRLTGGNVGIWREDFERVNGYDQNFIGWGFEDRDLQYRLCRVGVRMQSSLAWAHSYHLWHPRDPSFVRNGEGTQNRRYFFQPGRLTTPRNGLRQRELADIAVAAVLPDEKQDWAAQLLGGRFGHCHGPAEVEIVFTPGTERFSGQADCNVLVLLDQTPHRKLVRQAHIIVGGEDLQTPPHKPHFRLEQFEQALAAIV